MPTPRALWSSICAILTRSLVWRGIASEDKSDPAKIEGKLDDMVGKSLEEISAKAEMT